ncbi:LuxR C-terminal-related transcriptional regulator [Microbacterium sp. NIBRBAC000506063]|uniref:LuxR C-terminal-related transcriptional regulator n=1 Tax=Microbacterium sp. NIBRBAC000506063 TaxID=2734618 RepID=UPI0021D41699|nr:LuxR C-terminal-related transcriptional regulator [Microbacterium sp. NIBRBAC000506063]
MVVSAPAGYGKTVAVAAWAAQQATPVAWLRLTSFDTDRSRVIQGIVRALQAAAQESVADRSEVLALAPLRNSAEEVARQLLFALEALETPVTLVIDDAHRAAEGTGFAVIEALIASRPDTLRLVLVGTSRLGIALAGHLLTPSFTVLAAQELAFTVEEIASLRALTADPADPVKVFAETQGWPIAVRVMLLSGARRCAVPMPTPRCWCGSTCVTICSRCCLPNSAPSSSTRPLSTSCPAAWRRPSPGDRMPKPTWTAAPPRGCSWIGTRASAERSTAGTPSSPGIARRSHVWRTRHVGTTGCVVPHGPGGEAPLLAAERWLAASDPGEATRVILASWVRLVLGSEAASLDGLCATLPEPYASDPRVILVRACAQDQIGEEKVARMHFAHAEAVAGKGAPDGYDLVHAIACLILRDDRAEVFAAGELVRSAFIDEAAITASEHVAVLYVLAWAHMRVRSAPDRILELLTATQREAEAIDDADLATRAHRHRALTLAWAGMLAQSREVVAEIQARESMDPATWTGADGGTGELAAAIIAYWEDDLDAALPRLDRVIRNGSASIMGIDGAARLILAIVAASARRAPLMRRAAQELIAVPRQDLHGWSWPAFRQCALAVLDEAAGRRERALKIAQDLTEQAKALPLVAVVLSGVLRRGNDLRGALALLEGMGHYRELPHVRVAGLTTSALVHRRRGAIELMHETIERALDVASAEGIRRPFCDGELEIRELLTEHIAWGTPHDDFIAACLSDRSDGSVLNTLSERERAVFEQLRTNRTMQEVADLMGVSINTVKTHQRAIYRKLGVTSRREAVRLLL